MEKKYESDLTGREKLKQQWENIRRLKGKKRLEYLWSYYKFVLVILLAVILCIYTIGVMISGARENTVLSVVIVDAAQNKEGDEQELEQELLTILGADGAHDHVETVLTAKSLDTEDNVAKLRIALSAVGEADLVICNEEVYREYEEQGAFADIEPVFGEAWEDIQACLTDGQIDLSKCKNNAFSGYAPYAPAYVCVLKNSERMEAAEKILQELVK